MTRLLALAILCATVVACGPVRPLTDSEVYSFCLMGGSMVVDDTCDSEQDICNAYRDVVTVPYPGLSPCLDACNAAYESLIRVQYVGNCFSRINDGQDICIQYCRREYPKQ
ncbi:MAG: hypothetical protein RDU30_16110 [Desulfovibrionaceae bacterium]|nr:hypothetical protein [Desulfovibrionaceae bacterium]